MARYIILSNNLLIASSQNRQRIKMLMLFLSFCIGMDLIVNIPSASAVS